MQKIELFWDVGSPYTYLAVTQVPHIRQRTGAHVQLRPFLLGGVFKAVGNKMIDVVPKAKNLVDDLRRWSRYYRVPMLIPGVDPVPFPINSLLPMRAAMGAALVGDVEGEKLARTLFDALWVQGKDLSDRTTLEGVLGADAAAILARGEAQDSKDALRKNTEEAIERGAYGAPTFFVGSQLFWGNDRIHFVEEAARAGYDG